MRKIKRDNVIKGLILLAFIYLGMSDMFAQTKIRLTGTITDQTTNEPLIGVSVLEKGTNNGVVSDLDGNYTLNVTDGVGIVYSYVGYLTQEKTAVQGVINVSMVEDTQHLDEVVIVGYGVQKKSSVTGAISQVKAEDMLNRTITRPEQALQGKTAGVQIVQGSAAPGSSPDVRIRGLSSNFSSAPLFVVDGRIATNGIGGIDPNDIESMEVLKDAASSAIYGIAAGNGVVLITTKKGTMGKSSISYDFQTSTQAIARIPKVMNAEQYIDYMTEAQYLTMDAIMQNYDFKTNTDWSRETFEPSLMMRHNLAFQGGNAAGAYYLSLSYLDNDGYVKGDNDSYRRYTATINGSYNIKPWLEVGTNNQVEYYTRRNIAEGSEYGSLLMSVLQLDPLTPVSYAPDKLPPHMQSVLKDLYQDKDGNYYSLSPYQMSDQYNPFIMRDSRKHSVSKGYNVNGTVFANFKPIKELVVTSRFGYELSTANGYNFNQHFYANGTIRQAYNSLDVSVNTPVSYQWENFANYTQSFGSHNVNAMLGSSIRQSFNYGVTGRINGSDTDLGIPDEPLFAYPGYASPTAVRSVGGGEETRVSWFSVFGRLTYDYANRYFFQASLRRDGADLSTLPLNKRFGYFPAVSAGWAVSNENFFEPLLDAVSFLKLRASWGQNGSPSMLAGSWTWSSSIVHTTTSIGPGGPPRITPVIYPFTNALNYTDAYFPNVLGNPDLGWERSEQLDLGFDARFLNNRLTLGFDYFNKTTKDLIMTGVTLSTIVGNTASPINAGSISNKGVEVELGWNDRIGDFRYGIKANLATLHNEVTATHLSLPRINGARVHTNEGITVFERGYPAWYIRGFKVERIDPATGDPVFMDLEPDGIINDDDRTMIGNSMPDFTYGLTLTGAWKGFDLTLFATGAQGNDILLCMNRGDRLQANTLKIFYDQRWTTDNTGASRARTNASDKDKYWLSDAFIYDGSFLKIKQIQLGYTLPSSMLNKIYLSSVRAYVSLDDFFTFTSYPGFDPETVGTGQGMGLDKGNYPASRKIVLGMNITF
ncbi:MAG: TonB-dependent receptor [Bacteroidales bacterium]|jgi:TonB-linked SusC/RagA family outer membrane protein|nr:TonB-dependent receptor [Bacteroidales bacterium]